ACRQSHRHGPPRRRDIDRSAAVRLERGDRELEAQVGAVALERLAGQHLDREDDVARGISGPALLAQSQLAAVGHAFGHADVERSRAAALILDAQRDRDAEQRVEQSDLDLAVDVGAAPILWAGPTAAAKHLAVAVDAPAAEQPREK